MNSEQFTFNGANQKFFTPGNLPPEPKLHFDAEMRTLLSSAEKSLLLLEGSLSAVNETDYILNSLYIFEAVNSLAIDENEITFENFFASKAGIGQNKAADNLLSAMALGSSLLKNVGSSSHIFKSVYSEIIKGYSGSGEPEYRIENDVYVKNRNAGLTHIPPPPEKVAELMSGLEKYISDDISYPALINAALIHAQFEMIHPFAKGNGKIGRILILLHLKWKKLLSIPALAVSYALKNNKAEYFSRLADVEINNEWESWIKFFLRMIDLSSRFSSAAACRLNSLRNKTLQLIIENKFVSPASIELQDLLFKQPVITLPYLTETLRFTKQTANAAVAKFTEEKILRETTGQMRNRIFMFDDFFKCFNQ